MSQMINTEFLNIFCNKAKTRIPTAFDNRSAKIHRWFPYMAGFSYKLVESIIQEYRLDSSSLIYDPFCGCGTVAFESKKHNINFVGNESNPFMSTITMAKIQNIQDLSSITKIAKQIIKKAEKTYRNIDFSAEAELIKKCYTELNLKKLIALRNEINKLDKKSEIYNYLFLSLSNCLKKCAEVKISSPYVSWSSKNQSVDPFVCFIDNANMLYDDLESSANGNTNSKCQVYCHDSRIPHREIVKNSVDFVITSPPYLNNFDYGEATKVYLYFWGIANNWNEVTSKIRLNSIACATTCYVGSQNSIELKDLISSEFMDKCPKTVSIIIEKAASIRAERENKKRAKSFDALTVLYFMDMFKIMVNIYEVLKNKGRILMVVGDSAPYGIHIPVDELFVTMSKEIGFRSASIIELRKRGTKWKSLKYRHKVDLRESIIAIQK